MANNLELQGGTYHVRLAIPADVQKAFGNRRILSQSLMTGVHKEALDRRLPILAKWKNQIKIARDGKPLPDDWQDNIKAAIAELDARKRLKKLEIIGETSIPSTLTASEIDTWISKNPEAFARLEKAIETAAERGLQGEIDFQDALHFAFKADIEKRFNQKHKLTTEQQKDLIELLNGTYKPRSPITKTRLEAFRTFRIARNVELKTIDQQQSKLSKLSSFLTDTGRNLDYDAVTSWLESIKLSSKTLTQYLLAGSVFWKWALKHDTFWREEYKDRANPFENHDLPRVRGKDRAEAKRKDYTIEALANLHAEAMAEGRKALADLILLCIFTGARIEELCTLRSENVIEVEGVRCLDIPDSKTVAGIREVPIHPAITNLVNRLVDDSKDGYLIITDSMNKYGDRSGALGKEFGRLKKRLGYGRQHVFHSIRITMITQLIRASVPGTLIAELVGHETGLVTFDVYSQGASAGQKLEALGRLPALPSVQVAATKHGQALPDEISDGADLNTASNAR